MPTRVAGPPSSRRSRPRLRIESAHWLPKLRYPIRVGEHSQTAFAFGLMRDWSVVAGDSAMRALIDERSRTYYLG